VSDAQLTPDEDDELRLLHSLTTFGSVAHSVAARYHALRGRDRRQLVRDPDEAKVASPIEKKMWSDPPSAAKKAREDLEMTDTREVLAKPAEQKKNGFFRR
jgi:hypothetical protein